MFFQADGAEMKDCSFTEAAPAAGKPRVNTAGKTWNVSDVHAQ